MADQSNQFSKKDPASHSEEKRQTQNVEPSSCSSFYFESDQVALKNNQDYSSLLSSLSRLEAMRMKAIADLDRLHSISDQAKADPLGFVQKLQNDCKSLNIPARPVIPELPTIDWDKYTTNIDKSSLTRHGTRGKRFSLPDNFPMPRNRYRGMPSATNSDVQVVRGRVKDESKPDTFNQLWTVDEQAKLESLLQEFPPERVEARRFRKIADRLGNKTYAQVASRIQKYFIRLARSGLPVPGRMPNLNAHRVKNHHRHQKKNLLMSTSTFLQSYVPPVLMSDYEDGSEMLTTADSSTAASSIIDSEESSSSSESENEFPDSVKDSEEYRQLLEMKALRIKKLAELQAAAQNVRHEGYKCDGCGQEPMLGTRWHCVECNDVTSVDLCTECQRKNTSLENHPATHKLVAIHQPIKEGNIAEEKTNPNNLNDKDYLPNKFNIPGHYNYLDPNYMPLNS